MKTERLICSLIIGAMALAPVAHLLEASSEASVLPFAALRPDLLLSSVAMPVDTSLLAKLERNVVSTYKVGPHEDLWSICRRFHIDAFSIRSSNDLDERLPAGTVLRIPNHRGTLYEVTAPQSLRQITHGFTKGKLLGPVYEHQVLEVNDYPSLNLMDKDYPFPLGTELFLPDAWKPSGLPFPFVSDGHKLRITSGFGMRKHPILGTVRHHSGNDIAKPYGTPVMAAREGIVISAGWAGGYGNMIEIRHVLKSRGGTRIFTTRYGHLSKIMVHEGQVVHMYQMIGRVGSTGLSTGPHLHFEVRNEAGQALDPSGFQ